MRSNTTRIALAVGAIAALVVLFAVLSGGSDNNKSTTTNTAGKPSSSVAAPRPKAQPQVITVSGGKPVGGIKEVTYTKGDQVRLRIDSDVADEIHVHGYDFKKNVPAGGSVTFTFPATIEGIFKIELEKRGEQIARLTVNPG